VLENLPPIADAFWVYSRVLDMVQSASATSSVEASLASESESKAQVEEETKEETVHIEVEEVSEEEITS